MKASLLFVFFLLINGITFASSNKELDSLRQLLLKPKISKYQQQITTYTNLIATTNDKAKLKSYAKQIVDLSNDLLDDIESIYEYRIVRKRSSVYVGKNFSSALYPNVGGFIHPVNYITVGSLPDLHDEVAYIKDYAWRIRIFTKDEVVKRNVTRISKFNSKFIS